jgi:1-deoxy-D-xylulose-5-phosphate synthase
VDIDQDIRTMEIGSAEVLTEGEDVLLLAFGRPVNEALIAAKTLADEGVACTAVDCRFLKPLDTELIGELVARIPRVVTVEENVLQGGFGSAVLEGLSDLGVSGFALKRLGIPDRFVEHGPQALLRAKYGIDSDAIIRCARQMVGVNGRKAKSA